MGKQNGKKIVLGMLAHVDAGKTTLAEAMLYTAGSVSKRGRVDEKNSTLDTDAFERKRGITAFSKQAVLQVGSTSISLLDTPGHSDLFAETERVIGVLDYAVLVISGSAGVQADTIRLWHILQNRKIPTFLFISKMDLPYADRELLMEELREKLSANCIDFSNSLSVRNQQAAEISLSCLESYLEKNEITESVFAEAIQNREITPCFFGSGLKLLGVEDFLTALDHMTVMPEKEASFSAKIYKIARDGKGNRLSYAKMEGGTVSVRDSVFYRRSDGTKTEEKITEIRVYNGSKYETTASAEQGQVCAFFGLSKTLPGMVLGKYQDPIKQSGQSSWRFRVCFPGGTDRIEAERMIAQLEEEFPELAHRCDEKGISVSLFGKMQEDMFRYLFSSRFQLDVKLDPEGVEWKETITKPAEGVGHFEPLRHYAEVHLLLEPLPRGSGVQIESICPDDSLDRKWQNQILDILQETKIPGILTGAEIIDIRIRLVSAKVHLKHTDGGDIRQATLRAVRQGLMKAESQLLEPVSSFYISVPVEITGRVMSDLKERHAVIENTESDGLMAVMTGTIPYRFSSDLRELLRVASHGKGSITMHSAGYISCINEEEILSECSYSPEKDAEYPIGSVFCAHGAGFSVSWNMVENYMHLPSAVKTERTGAKPEPFHIFSLDEQELEAIMEREFGPIRRPVYSSPVTVGERKKAEPRRNEQTVIIDGYNYIFSREDLRKLANISLDTARTVLSEMLINYAGFSGKQVILVFDGFRTRGNPGSKTDTVNIHVVFTKENETADAYIERILYEIGKNEAVSVVTGDHMIRLSAIHSGVLRVSPDEFHQMLQECFQKMKMTLEKTRSMDHKTLLQDGIVD